MPDAPADCVNVTREGGVLTARITVSTIEEPEAAAVLRTVQAAIDEIGPDLRAVVLDLGEVTFINSTGLAACIKLRNGADKHGAPTIVYRAGAEVADLFRLVQVDRLYAFARDNRELDHLVSQ